jgi:hypothetical protein
MQYCIYRRKTRRSLAPASEKLGQSGEIIGVDVVNAGSV